MCAFFDRSDPSENKKDFGSRILSIVLLYQSLGDSCSLLSSIVKFCLVVSGGGWTTIFGGNSPSVTVLVGAWNCSHVSPCSQSISVTSNFPIVMKLDVSLVCSSSLVGCQ